MYTRKEFDCLFFISSEGECFHREKLLPTNYKLVDDEQWVWEKIGALQERVNWGRFRLDGGLYRRHPKDFVEAQISVTTEFCHPANDEAFWKSVKSLARSTGASLWVMDRRPMNDGSRRVEQQVGMSWRVEAMAADEFASLMNRLKDATEPIWKEAGVGVC